MSEKGLLVNYALFLPSVRKKQWKKRNYFARKRIDFFQIFKANTSDNLKRRSKLPLKGPSVWVGLI